MHTRVRVSPITPEQLKQKLKKSKLTKRNSARRTKNFKSDSWYSNAMLSIGVEREGLAPVLFGREYLLNTDLIDEMFAAQVL